MSPTDVSAHHSWIPLSEQRLAEMLSESETLMSSVLKGVWNHIRLPHAEIWQQHPWGDEGCGFWVVGVLGKSCIYFNDLSRGFNIGRFYHWGEIADFEMESQPLDQLLQQSIGRMAS